jgi:hypothetical protein
VKVFANDWPNAIPPFKTGAVLYAGGRLNNMRYYMDKNVLLHLAVFIAALYALNFIFSSLDFPNLHISIIGSLLLTLGLSAVMGLIQR